MKLGSTSSAEKNFPDAITWITGKTKQNLEIWPFLNSHLEFSVWESCPKIDPATGVRQGKHIVTTRIRIHINLSYLNPQLRILNYFLKYYKQWSSSGGWPVRTCGDCTTVWGVKPACSALGVMKNQSVNMGWLTIFCFWITRVDWWLLLLLVTVI